MSNQLPNFLIVGAAKCGTTSIYKYLKQHPQIFMPEHKEPLFMMSAIYKNMSRKDPRYEISERHTVFSFDAYKNLFRKVKSEKAIGEASATYLYYHATSVPNIKKHLGDIRIIISLRNPVDRAYSSYTHLIGVGAENSSFEEFLENEGVRKSENWDILNFPKDPGFYYDQVKAYLENFKHVKVCLFDDLKERPIENIKSIYAFLDVNQTFEPDIRTVYNKSGIKKNGLLNYLLIQDNVLKDIARPVVRKLILPEKRSKMSSYLRNKNLKTMTLKTRNSLKKLFKEDILKLQDLIDRDLTHWL